jgi:hypothetical protein
MEENGVRLSYQIIISSIILWLHKDMVLVMVSSEFFEFFDAKYSYNCINCL